MTREKAIDLLSMIEFEQAECCLNTWYKGIDDDMKEALEMAIKTLEQEPTYYPPCIDCHKKMDEIRIAYDKLKEQQPCDDCISREEAIRIAEQGQIQGYEWQFKELVKLPSVSTEKTGRWTIKQYQVPIENKQVPTISCTALPEPTACKIVYTYTHSACKSEEYFNKYTYCPNCGAKMVEPQESEVQDADSD